MPGVPFLYYGDEIGMRFIEGLSSKEGGYDRTGTRTPMQWESGKNLGFSATHPAELYLPVDSSADAPTVFDQQSDPDSLLTTVKALISLRQRYTDLNADGDFEVIHAKAEDPLLVYRRGSLLVFVNPGADTIRMDWERAEAPGDVVYELGQFAFEQGQIILSPQSFAVVSSKTLAIC
jgi:maltose alpha-D-glucosyltransferase/alpha-amylase